MPGAFHPDSERLNQLDAKRRDGELSEAEFDEWMELKDKGLVHRDIKPLNVILARKGAKLLDFNITSRVSDEVKTQSGTPPYQPPDANLTRWDVSSDLYPGLAEFLIKACASANADRFPMAVEMQLALRNIRAAL